MRKGAYTAEVPIITGKISWKGDGGENFCADEWRKSMAAINSKVNLKYTIPGPMTIMSMFHNKYYEGRDKDLAADLAKVINA